MYSSAVDDVINYLNYKQETSYEYKKNPTNVRMVLIYITTNSHLVAKEDDCDATVGMVLGELLQLKVDSRLQALENGE